MNPPRPRIPLIIGHRGYSAVAPENTLPAFARALAAGAKLIECDFQRDQDGELVVIHDETLDRTTDARKQWRARRIKVAVRTTAQIQSLDAGSWFDAGFAGAKVPTLAEAVEFILARGGTPVVEHKSGDARACAELLRRRHWIGRIILLSFDWHFLRAVHAIEPQQQLGALGKPSRLANGRRPPLVSKKLGPRWLDLLADTGAQLVVWNTEVPKGAIACAHERGLDVWVYTVNQPRLALRLRDAGVDGIITNEIERIRDAFAGRRRP